MPTFVVDTNVAIVANGRGTHADISCRLRCIAELQSLVKQGIVVIDDRGLIVDEYKSRLNFSGAPSVGDMFFKHVFNLHQDEKVRRVAVTPSIDDRKGFEELPENTFDRSDRKFLAVAVAADAVVLNAMDSDWSNHQALMDELEVEVEELCPQHLPAGQGEDN